MSRPIRLALASLVLLAPLAAVASPGFVTTSVNLRAGPDTDYPAVDVLPGGIGVDIQGCNDGYAWCDVIVDGTRGWVAGQFVQFDVDNRRVYVRDYGPRYGIPIVAFALGAYWDSYYRGRPWYGDRGRWIGSTHGHRPVIVGGYGGYHGPHDIGYHGPVHGPVHVENHYDPHGGPGHDGHYDPHGGPVHVENHAPSHVDQGHHDEHHDDHDHNH